MSSSANDKDKAEPKGGVFADLLEEANPASQNAEEDAKEQAAGGQVAEQQIAEQHATDGQPEADPADGVSDTLEGAGEPREPDLAALAGVSSTLPWPPKPVVADSARVETADPPSGETEGLCQAMPDIGALPFAGREVGEHRVVRLVSSAEDSDLSIELQPGINKIGRQRNENHIVLVSPDISRFHAQILVTGDGIEISDNGSSNGTFVNGQQVEQKNLEAGDMVAFSDEFSFRVLIDLPLSSPATLTLSDAGQEPESSQADAAESASDATPPSSRDTFPEEWDQPPSTSDDEVSAPPTSEWGSLPAEALTGPEPAPQGYEPIPDQPLIAQPQEGGTTAQPELSAQALDPLPMETAPPPTDLRDEETPPPLHSRVSIPGEVGKTIPTSTEVVELERERRQLAVLFQLTKRCMKLQDLEELERLLINVLERMVAFQRAFITYQLANGDWKLVMSKHAYNWQRRDISRLLYMAHKSDESVRVDSSVDDPSLGVSDDGRPDTRLLLPLWAHDVVVGTIFLVSQIPSSFEDTNLHFLEQFSEVAALALYNCAQQA